MDPEAPGSDGLDVGGGNGAGEVGPFGIVRTMPGPGRLGRDGRAPRDTVRKILRYRRGCRAGIPDDGRARAGWWCPVIYYYR